MPNISMPNGDIVNFPDDMPKEEIRTHIKTIIEKKFPNFEQNQPKPVNQTKRLLREHTENIGGTATDIYGNPLPIKGILPKAVPNEYNRNGIPPETDIYGKTVDPNNTSTKEIGEFGLVGDIAFPTVGSVVGSVAGPLGAIAGGMAGEGLKHLVETIRGADKTLFPKTVKEAVVGDTVAGSIVTEGLLSLFAPQLLKMGSKGVKILKSSKTARSVGTGLSTKVNKSGELINKSTFGGQDLGIFKPKEFQKIKDAMAKNKPGSGERFLNYLRGVASGVNTPEGKAKLIKGFVTKGEELGIPAAVTERALERTTKVVIDPKKYTTNALNSDTIKEANTAFKHAFSEVDEIYNNVESILENSTERLDVESIIKWWSNAVSKEDMLSVSKKGTIRTGLLLKHIPISNFKDFMSSLQSIQKNPTPIRLHRFKDTIKLLLDKKKISGTPIAKKLFTDMHKKVSKTIDDAVPGYIDRMKEFKNVFDLKKEIGKIEGDKFTTMAKKYFSGEKAVLEDAIDSLISIAPDSSKVINDGLDNVASSFFISAVKKRTNKFSIPMARGLNIPFHFGSTSREKFGQRLLRPAKEGFQDPTKKGLLRAGQSTIPRVFNQFSRNISEQFEGIRKDMEEN